MATKTANLNVRMNPDLLEKFRELVEKNEFSTPLEVVRGWIEEYVALGGREDYRLKYAMISQQIDELRYEIRILSGEFERSEKADLNREPYKTAIENMKKTNND